MSDEPTGRDVEAVCVLFHDAYEAAAVGAGWETQERSRKPWADVPEANKATMRATIRAVLASAWYAERIAEARREAAAEALAPVDETLDGMAARPPYDLNDALRRLLTLRAALRGDTP